MSSYISSNANRFYTVLESAYGNVAAITASNRIPALKLAIQQQREIGTRKDKTGTRTFAGLPAGGRLKTTFKLQTYMTSWNKPSAAPGYGPLFQAALGGTPQQFGGGTVASSTADGKLGFTAAHGLSAGQAVASTGEIRFVAAIVDANNVLLNVPFTVPPAVGATLGAAVTYVPATELPSVSIFDFWSPATAVQRLLCGAAVDELEIAINGDYHEFQFSGVSQDVVDSSSFSANVGELQSFPQEPAIGPFDYSIVPGNMGQAWLGTTPSQFFTVTNASVVVKNNLDTRTRSLDRTCRKRFRPGSVK